MKNAQEPRTILAAEKNLIKNNKLSSVNFEALKDAYIYDTSASIGALISFLRKMREIIDGGKSVECDVRGQAVTISTEQDYNNFVNAYFKDIVRLM